MEGITLIRIFLVKLKFNPHFFFFWIFIFVLYTMVLNVLKVRNEAYIEIKLNSSFIFERVKNNIKLSGPNFILKFILKIPKMATFRCTGTIPLYRIYFN